MLGDMATWLADHPKVFEQAAGRHLSLSLTALAGSLLAPAAAQQPANIVGLAEVGQEQAQGASHSANVSGRYDTFV